MTDLEMARRQNQENLLFCARQLDYWTPRKDKCLEGQEQHEYYTNLIKFMVTKYVNNRPVRQDGANIVFPCL